MHFELFKNRVRQWNWRLKASNGKIIADSAESYINKADAIHGINLVKSTNASTPVYEL